MPENDFLTWATGIGANVLDQASYAAAGARTEGVTAGTALSNLYNKAQRQSGFMGAVVAKFIVDQTASDMIDDGDLNGKTLLFGTALDIRIADALTGYATETWVGSAIAASLIGYATEAWVNLHYAPIDSPIFTGVPKAPTPAPGDSSTKIATTAFVIGAGAAATLANPGELQIPTVAGTVLIKWGTANLSTGNGDVVNFSTPFPHACFGVSLTNISSGDSYPTYNTLIASGFHAWLLNRHSSQNPTAGTLFYIAVGW